MCMCEQCVPGCIFWPGNEAISRYDSLNMIRKIMVVHSHSYSLGSLWKGTTLLTLSFPHLEGISAVRRLHYITCVELCTKDTTNTAHH